MRSPAASGYDPVVTAPMRDPAAPGQDSEDELGRLRELIDRFPGMIYLEDADPGNDGPGRFLYVSPAVERMLGFTVQEWLADPAWWVDRLHPDDVPSMREAYQTVVPTGAPYRAEYRMFAKDGRIVWIHDEAELIRDEEGTPLCWQGVMYETADRVEALDRKQRAAELELELEAQREEAAELRAIDELKTTFLRAVSHDLRTPLAAILGLSVTLETQEDLGPDETRDLARRISMNARKLDRIVSDLLDLDRISRGILEPNLQETDLEELVRRVVEESGLLPADRKTELDLESVTIEADAAKIERIFENLLSNAIRHTPAESRIWIRVAPDAGGALLVVEDDGPGVPLEHRESIFQPFGQGAGPPEHAPGLGIGLAVVARFAELHGGRAWVQERDGGGASFHVFLPDRSDRAPAI